MKTIAKLSLFTYINLTFNLLIFSSIIYSLQAQTTLDSLQKALKRTSNTEAKVDIYNNLIEIYIQQSDSVNAVHNFDLAIKLAKQLSYWEGLSRSHLNITELYFDKNVKDSLALHHLNESLYAAKQSKNIELEATVYKRTGIIHRRKGNYHLALQNYQLALQIYESLEDLEGVAMIQNNIGNVYSNMGNYTLALKYILTSLKYWEDKNDLEKIGIISNNVGAIHIEQKDYAIALPYFHKSLELMQALNNQPRIASASNNLGISLGGLKDYNKSRFYYQKALKTYQELKDDYGIARVSHNLGVSYQKTKEYDKALRFLENSLKIRTQLNTQYGIASTMIAIGDTYLYLKSYEQAESFLLKGKEIAQDLGRLDKVQVATNSLAKLYYNQGKYKQAYEAQVLFTQLSDSLINREVIKQITWVDADYKFQQQTDSLQQIQEHEKEVLRLYNTNYRWFVALLIIGIIALLSVIWVLINRRKQITQTIELQNVKQKLLQEQLQRKEIEEKSLQEQLSTLEDKDFELTRQALHLVQKQQLLDTVEEEIKDITKLGDKTIQKRLKVLNKLIRKETSTKEEWQNFTQTFEIAHPSFFSRLQQHCPELTEKDLKLAALLRLGFDSNELALILNITSNSVRTARMRIRKKLELDEKSLSEFMRTF